jgi:peptidyl-prolyl cis-trans isomerase SurA
MLRARHFCLLPFAFCPCVLAFCLLPSAACGGTVLDRIAVVVGTQVITETQIDLGIRVTALMQDDPLDFSAAAKHKEAERQIEQKLILKELEFSRFPRPTMSDVLPRLRAIIQRRFHDSEDEFRAALKKYGLTEEDFEKHVLWQITFLRFIDFRFRPGIQVTEAEIEEHFKTQILPLAQKANPGKPVTLEDYHDRIERVLRGRREDAELNTWLKETRARTRIEYREEVLQ